MIGLTNAWQAQMLKLPVQKPCTVRFENQTCDGIIEGFDEHNRPIVVVNQPKPPHRDHVSTLKALTSADGSKILKPSDISSNGRKQKKKREASQTVVTEKPKPHTADMDLRSAITFEDYYAQQPGRMVHEEESHHLNSSDPSEDEIIITVGSLVKILSDGDVGMVAEMVDCGKDSEESKCKVILQQPAVKEGHLLITKWVPKADLSLWTMDMPSKWTGRIVMCPVPGSRVMTRDADKKTGTLTAEEGPNIGSRAWVRWDDGTKSLMSIGAEEEATLDLIFDHQVMTKSQLPVKGQMVSVGPMGVNAKWAIYQRVIKATDRTQCGTVVEYSTDFGLHVVYDRKTVDGKLEEWIGEHCEQLIFQHRPWKLPKPGQALTLPNGCDAHPGAEQFEYLIGYLVVDWRTSKQGTLLRIGDDKTLTIYWDNQLQPGASKVTCSLREQLDLRTAAVTCRFLSTVRDSSSAHAHGCGSVQGRVMTKAPKAGMRVTSGPHYRCRTPNDPSANFYGTVLYPSYEDTVTVLVDSSPWPTRFKIGLDNEYELCHADDDWTVPRFGQLVTRGVLHARVARSLSELQSGKNWGTIFDMGARDSTHWVRVVWHDTEKVETIPSLPDGIRFADY